MCESIAEYFLIAFYTLSDDDHDVRHEVRPGGEVRIAVDEDVV